MNDITILLLGLVIVIFILSVFIQINQSRRALKGLDLIENSKISPLEKLQLYGIWGSPYATRKQYQLLADIIKDKESS